MMGQCGRRNWRRYKIFFGLAAIGAFLLALPAAALACISANQCTSGGGFVSVNVCAGGSQNNQQICSSGQSGELPFQRLGMLYASAAADYDHDDTSSQWFMKDDPFVDYSDITDKGANVTSAGGTVGGQYASSHTTNTGGGLVGASNGLNKVIGLSADQSLIVGLQARFDSFQTQYGTGTLAPAALNVGTSKESVYSVTAGGLYYFGSNYVGGILNGDWGTGAQTNATTSGTGSFGVHGYAISAIGGKVFALEGPAFEPPGANPSPGKPAPPLVPGVYSLRLDVSGHVFYRTATADAFTDSTGFVFGDERLRYWDVGANGRLYGLIPAGEITWEPWIAASIDQQFGYSYSEFIPSLTDTLLVGTAQTFLGGQIGVAAHTRNGFVIGVQGTFAQSAEFQIAGGRAFLQYVFQ